MENNRAEILGIARKLINLIREKERHTSPDEVGILWQNVELRASLERRAMVRRRVIRIAAASSAAAACVCAVFALGHFRKESAVEPLTALAEYASAADTPCDRIMLLTPEMEGIEFGSSDADIVYEDNGTVTVNTISLNRPVADGYSRLLVPKGRRARLALPDGTHLWVNSGSRVIFPGRFDAGHREIYVEGEVYMDVAHDADAPFTVMTEDFRVKVLGTSFNINAYPGETSSSVVLVNGCVNLSDVDDNEVRMSPGQIVNICTGKLGKPEETDVEAYVCWVRSMLICHDETLETVFRKLNLAYAADFVLGPGVGSLKVSGKLNLKDSLEDVLHTISFSAPVYCESTEGKIYVWKN